MQTLVNQNDFPEYVQARMEYAWVLRIIHGCAYREIADRLGISRAFARQLAHRWSQKEYDEHGGPISYHDDPYWNND